MDRTNRTLWIGLGILALLFLVGSSWGGGMMMGRGFVGPFGMRPFVGPWLIGLWGFGALIRLLFVGGLIFLVVRLFGRSRRHYYNDDSYYTNPEHLPADEILRRRYAAGDISREQYEDMLRTVHPAT